MLFVGKIRTVELISSDQKKVLDGFSEPVHIHFVATERRQKEEIMNSTVLITGNTYPVKDQIKALDGKWDAVSKGWLVPADKAEKAKQLVDGTVKYSDDKWGRIDAMWDKMDEYRRLKYLSCL